MVENISKVGVGYFKSYFFFDFHFFSYLSKRLNKAFYAETYIVARKN